MKSGTNRLAATAPRPFFSPWSGRLPGLWPSRIRSRLDARSASNLHQEGLRIVMLTGDSRTTAEAVAGRLGIDAFEAEVQPHARAKS